MNTSDLTVGSQIEHSAFGAGRVTFVGTDHIGIRFDDQHEFLFNRDVLERDPPAPDEPKAAATTDLPWPASTFVAEPADAQHFMGSHWDAFFEASIDFMRRLPEVLASATVQGGYGVFYKSARQEPEDWPKGFGLVWPLGDKGAAMILKIEPQANMVVSVFPFCNLGSQVTLKLDKVCVWDGGLEAQITAIWGEAVITFFDTRYVVNRAWYEAGKRYDFILSGVAYSAAPAKPHSWTMQRHPDEVDWLNQRLAPGEPPEQAEMTIHLEGAALFSAVDNWDADDYNFRAPIKAVTEFTGWLGQDGWRVKATVMRFGDTDADLDILITRRAWRGDAPPQVGQDIEGSLWLQGYLWMPLSPH